MDKKPKKKRAEKYEDKVSLDASFEDVLRLTFAKPEVKEFDGKVTNVIVDQEEIRKRRAAGKKKKKQ